MESDTKYRDIADGNLLVRVIVRMWTSMSSDTKYRDIADGNICKTCDFDRTLSGQIPSTAI